VKWVEKTKTRFDEARLLKNRQDIHFSDYTDNRNTLTIQTRRKIFGPIVYKSDSQVRVRENCTNSSPAEEVSIFSILSSFRANSNIFSLYKE